MTSSERRNQATLHQATAERLEMQYLRFPLGEERFAVEILMVQEIRPLTAITPIPNAPHHVRGVINLRGTIVPVFDLRLRFGLSMSADTRFAIILVVTIGERVVGLIADAVPKVLTVHADEVAPPPDFGQRVDISFISGVLHREEELVLLLDLDHLLAAELGDLQPAQPANTAA